MSGGKLSAGQRLGNKNGLRCSCKLRKEGSIAVKSRSTKGRPSSPAPINRAPLIAQNQIQRLSSIRRTVAKTPNPAIGRLRRKILRAMNGICQEFFATARIGEASPRLTPCKKRGPFFFRNQGVPAGSGAPPWVGISRSEGDAACEVVLTPPFAERNARLHGPPAHRNALLPHIRRPR